MSTMYIFGDSFVAAEKNARDQERTWWYRAAKKLDCDGFQNWAFIGSSQEYTWYMLQSFIDKINPNDYLLISMTHPGRRWWWQEDPSLGRPEFIRDRQEIDPKIANTAEMWERYIQRPVLDILPSANRLGWLAYHVLKRNLRRPMILMGFEQVTPDLDLYSQDLNISKGFMTEHVANLEIVGGNNADVYNSIIKGHDPRYNHMCLSNHEIMIDKVVDSFISDTAIDLTRGFKTNLIDHKSLSDPEFVRLELDPIKFNERDKKIKDRTIWNRFKSVGGLHIK